jgi:hypothetical protein
MRHLFFLLMLVVSLFAIFAALSGRFSTASSVRRVSTAPAPRPPVMPARARTAPRSDPVGTVHRVVRSGSNLGHSTRKAFEGLD